MTEDEMLFDKIAGSLFGNGVGANVGLSGIPQRFIDGLIPAPRIREVAETFFAAAMDARSGVRK